MTGVTLVFRKTSLESILAELLGLTGSWVVGTSDSEALMSAIQLGRKDHSVPDSPDVASVRVHERWWRPSRTVCKKLLLRKLSCLQCSSPLSTLVAPSFPEERLATVINRALYWYLLAGRDSSKSSSSFWETVWSRVYTRSSWKMLSQTFSRL